MVKAKLAIGIAVGFGGNLRTGEMTDEAYFRAYLIDDTETFFIILGRNIADPNYPDVDECYCCYRKEMIELMLSFLYAEPYNDVDIPVAIKDYRSDYCMYVTAENPIDSGRFDPLDVEDTLESLLITEAWRDRVQELIATCPV